jgi:hypothetical protein
MENWDDEELEKFIRDNKDKFDIYRPGPDHYKHFLGKLVSKFREVINIVPYLVKVGITTLLIFILSFFIWRIYICPPLTHISFKYWKAEHDYKRQIQKSVRLAFSNINNPEEEARFKSTLKEFDDKYNVLKKRLKEDPSTDNITGMLQFYQEKLLSIQEKSQNYNTQHD